MGLLESWAVFSRHPHSGYDAMPPDQSCLVEMHFKNPTQAQACYDYVEADQEPLRSLHRTMNKKVTDTIFALYENVPYSKRFTHYKGFSFLSIQ